MPILGFELSPVGIQETREQKEWEKSEARRAANWRPMCSLCGRFLPKASVKARRISWEYAEYEHTGNCATHGLVDVIWPEI